MDQSSPVAAAPTSQKRHQIVEAAVALFLAQGYGAVSMDAIARSAGVSKATLYAYFTSKDQLFATLIGDACRENTENGANFPAEASDIAEALTQIGACVLHFVLQERKLAIYRMTVAEATRFPELGQAFMVNGPQRVHQRLAEWMEQQTRAGRLATPDAPLAADQFLALLRTGMFLRATLGLGPAPGEEEIAATVAGAVATFLRAFGAG